MEESRQVVSVRWLFRRQDSVLLMMFNHPFLPLYTTLAVTCMVIVNIAMPCFRRL